jgi:outer membrane immunogenic protein
MKRLLFAGGLFFAVLGQGVIRPVLAADLPEPPPPPMAPAAYIPTVIPVYNWGGLYFGANAGYAFGTSNWSFPVGTTGDFNVNGWTTGATVGANLQADAFVFGLEGDFGAVGIKGTATCRPANCETRENWLVTMRGRAGYAVDKILFYGTAGGAYGTILANTGPTTSFADVKKAGWTAGAGIEAAFAENWTARLEYLYVDLQNGSFNGVPGTITVKYDANMIRAGIDYKFR